MKNKHIKEFVVASSMSMENVIAMSEKHPFSITAAAKGKTAEVRISGVIWNWGNSATWFRQEIEKFNADGVSHMKLHINTPGGDVFQANEIYNEIEAFNGTVEGIGGALVASAGTYIALACDTFTLPSNGSWMYHKPIGSLKGNEDAIESSLQLLKNLTSQYRSGYAEKTSLTEKTIEKNWAKGDVWLSPEQALKDGFITGIRKSKAKVTEETTALFAACAAPEDYIPKASKKESKNKKSNDTNMETLEAMAIQLGLPRNATQEQVDAQIKEIQVKAQKVETMEEDAKKKDAEQKAADIKAFLDQAQTDKKIDAKGRASLEGWAKTDLPGCKAYVEGLPTLEAISKGIKGNTTPSATAAGLADKKFEAMTQEEQDKLAEEDPEAFRAKYNEYLEAQDN